MTDASDYTIPVHGERRGLHHVAIEVRQDLITDDKGHRAWDPLLARLLAHAYRELVAAEALRYDVGEEFATLQDAEAHATIVANELVRNCSQAVTVSVLSEDGILLAKAAAPSR